MVKYFAQDNFHIFHQQFSISLALIIFCPMSSNFMNADENEQ